PGTRGAVAAVGAACKDGEKAKAAVVGITPIVGAKELIAHEIGHMYSATHTYNSSLCPQRQAETAYEPGSGTTIMSTGGCGEEQIDGFNNYFHVVSLEQITGFRDSLGSSCGSAIETGNNPPTVSAGSDFTIPRQTPFRLTGAGNDPEGDSITYAWEQFDLGRP